MAEREELIFSFSAVGFVVHYYSNHLIHSLLDVKVVKSSSHILSRQLYNISFLDTYSETSLPWRTRAPKSNKIGDFRIFIKRGVSKKGECLIFLESLEYKSDTWWAKRSKVAWYLPFYLIDFLFLTRFSQPQRFTY